MKRLGYKEKNVLYKALDLDKLLESSPEIFDFNKLSFESKIELLQENLERFQKHIPLDKVTADQKYEILTNIRLEPIHKDYKLDINEARSLKDEHYVSLLKTNFKSYVDKDRVLKLKRDCQCDVFMQNPEWYIKELPDNTPRLTCDTLSSLASKKPKFIEKYVTDFSELATSDRFWMTMIKYSDRYKTVFLENSRSCITKTDVRRVFTAYPDLVKLLTPENIVLSKLTVKELVLLSDSLIKKKPKIFDTWEFSAEMKELIRLDLSAELLAGKSEISKQLSSALARIST